MDAKGADPKGLVRESYAIPGITAGECRSILVDWALSLGPDAGVPDAIAVLLAQYGAAWPDHPMTALLSDGLTAAPAPRRRGGRSGRVPPIEG